MHFIWNLEEDVIFIPSAEGQPGLVVKMLDLWSENYGFKTS
jgi:hypothetical protein